MRSEHYEVRDWFTEDAAALHQRAKPNLLKHRHDNPLTRAAFFFQNSTSSEKEAL